MSVWWGGGGGGGGARFKLAEPRAVAESSKHAGTVTLLTSGT